MADGYVIPLAPDEMAKRFAVQPIDPFDDQETLPDDDSAAALYRLHSLGLRVREWLDQLPAVEADAIEMLLEGKTQAEIGAVFCITQAAVSYRINRGIRRLRYIAEMPDLTHEFEVLLPAILDRTTLSVVHALWMATSQSVAAERLKMTQGRIRHRYLKGLQKVEAEALRDPRYTTVARALRKLTLNWNILHEVILPQHRGRQGLIR